TAAAEAASPRAATPRCGRLSGGPPCVYTAANTFCRSLWPPPPGATCMRRLPAAALLSLSLTLVACKAERTADQDAAALLEAPSTAIEAMTPDTDPAGAAAAI